MLAQQQNLRAAMAPQPPSDGTNMAQGGAADTTGGRNSPVGQAFRTVTREGTGPDGQRYSFRITMNEAIVPSGATPPPQPGMAPRPPSAFSAADVRNMMHGADAARAAQAMANAMQRNASGAHPANMAANMAAELAHFNFNTPIQPIQPGVTTPIFPGVSRNPSRAASRAGTPDIPSRSVSHGSGVMPSIFQNMPPPQAAHGQPVVYILNSPAGPQGLLVNSASELYTTPAARPPFYLPNFPRPMVHPSLFPDPHVLQGQPYIPGQAPLHTPGASPRLYQPPPPAVQQQPLPQANNQPQPAIRRRPVAAPAAPAVEAQPPPQVNHPINPGVAPLVAAVWPHIWLIIRLIAFAWWFSYTNPSGERWLVLALSMALVFAINTGIFNGMVNNAFHPVREHLEGLLPLADPGHQQQPLDQQNQPDPTAANQFGADGAGGDPDPAQVAARLVAQRRIQNGSWLRDQMRRIERAGILFLASFAPGVAERHIRQQEERERAERAAAEAARAAAVAAAAAEAEAAAAAAAAEGQQEGEAAGESQAGEGSEAVAAQEQPPQAQPQPPPPLVQV